MNPIFFSSRFVLVDRVFFPKCIPDRSTNHLVTILVENGENSPDEVFAQDLASRYFYRSHELHLIIRIIMITIIIITNMGQYLASPVNIDG